jgi:transcriptional regulator with XRE-family HTH domain
MRTSFDRQPDTTRRAVGQRIRSIRVSKGLTQADLAGPYSRAYISLLEAGGIAPSPRAVETLAARLGVEPADLRAHKIAC